MAQQTENDNGPKWLKGRHAKHIISKSNATEPKGPKFERAWENSEALKSGTQLLKTANRAHLGDWSFRVDEGNVGSAVAAHSTHSLQKLS